MSPSGRRERAMRRLIAALLLVLVLPGLAACGG